MSRHVRIPRHRTPFWQQVRDYRGEILRDALQLADGNQSEAARYLGLSRSAFNGMLRRTPMPVIPLEDGEKRPHGFAIYKTKRGLPLLIMTCWTRADMLQAMRDRKLLGLFSSYTHAMQYADAVRLAQSNRDRVSPVLSPVLPDRVREDEGRYYAPRDLPGVVYAAS